MNIANLLRTGAARDPSGPAWTFGGRSATYAQLRERVARLAAGFTGIGLAPGDRVVLLLPNSSELVEALLAAMWGGFVAVPVNWHLHPQEVAYVLRHCAAGAVVVADETADAVSAFDGEVAVLHVHGAYEGLFGGAPAPLADVGPDDPAWLFYTSGTTGRPKGATLTHRNLLSMTLNYYADVDPVAPGSVFVHAAPLTHGSGLYLLPALGRGASNVISTARSFDPADYLSLLAEHRATHAAFMAPTMLKRLLVAGDPASHDLRAHDLTTLRSIVVGGAPFYRADLRAAVARFGPIVSQIFGQGESPMTITVMRPGDGERSGSCGRAFTGVQVRVVDAGGAALSAGVDGEVCVRGDVVMRGYWDDPDATAAALRGGWLHTGDIGHLDGEGYLHLTDRAKDVIITGGSNVYPREVEEVLLSHPGVREVAVIGRPDPEWGESVCAFVVPEPGAVPAVAELVEHSRGQLASFKKPKEIVFVDTLPKSAAGKILKRELRSVQTAPMRPFRIDVGDDLLADLRRRLRATRWPDRETVDGWSQGVPLGYLQDLCRYWEQDYDWRAREALLNRFDQLTTTIDGLGIHLIHQRSPVRGAMPLVITHGWPGSVAEFAAVIGPLTDPVAHGGDAADAFHVVCPTLPGFGFSGKPDRAGWGVERVARAWCELMDRLGYPRFGAQGGDWGSHVTTMLGANHPDRLIGIHVNLPIVRLDPGEDADPDGAEAAALAAREYYDREDSGYSKQQSTRPQTLGYGLTDSPAGQAAWIVEKFAAWMDCDGRPENLLSRDKLLDAVMLYWVTGSAASSARLYWESFRKVVPGRVSVPTGVAAFPKEIIPSAPRWVDRRYNLVHWTDMPRGGHFAALEQPELFVDDVRAFFRTLR